jgi:hypothetical protein
MAVASSRLGTASSGTGGRAFFFAAGGCLQYCQHADVSRPAAATAKTAVAAGLGKEVIAAAALSFTSSEKNRYRYRLEPFDAEWIEAGTGQTAAYTRPPVGVCRFHVSACNNDGVWNEAGSVLELKILPFFWQTTCQAFGGAGGYVIRDNAGSLPSPARHGEYHRHP